MSTGITHITSAAQLDKLLTASGSNLTVSGSGAGAICPLTNHLSQVIDFHATWYKEQNHYLDDTELEFLLGVDRVMP